MPQDAGHAFYRCAMTCAFEFKAQYKFQVIIIIIQHDFQLIEWFITLQYKYIWSSNIIISMLKSCKESS